MNTPRVLGGHELLYGTAKPQLQKDRKTEMPHLNVSQQQWNQRRGKGRAKKLKQFLGRCLSCCSKNSVAVDANELVQASTCSGNMQTDDSKTMHDHSRDRCLQMLLQQTGRQPVIREKSFPHSSDVQPSVRQSMDVSESERDETLLKHHGPSQSPAATVKASQASLELPCSKEGYENQTMAKSSFRSPIHTHSMNGGALVNDVSETGAGVSSQEKNLGSEPHAAHRHLSDDVKRAVNRVSEELNPQVQAYSLGLRQASRNKVQFIPRKRLMLKHLFSFRNFRRYIPEDVVIQMMNDSEFCYPRYSDRDARSNTLRNCTSVQLCGFDRVSLARAGWFFNRRTLITFCCGMEMPATPHGLPDDVHIGLSPQCQFALQSQGFVAGMTGSERQTTERPQEVDQASGRRDEIKFSIPVQASDDGSQSSAFADGYLFSDYSWGSRQETEPGDQWVTDGASDMNARTSHVEYSENFVTNRTTLGPQQGRPNSGNQQLPAAQRALPAASNTQQSSHGRMLLRINTQNPLGLEEPDGGQRSPHSHVPMDPFSFETGRDGNQGRYPQFGFSTIRMLTFEGWPRGHPQTASMMADAGLFYAGKWHCLHCYMSMLKLVMQTFTE